VLQNEVGSYDGGSIPSPDRQEDEENINESDIETDDVLDLEYDFEDDINEEMDYFIDMPWPRGGLSKPHHLL